MGWEAVTPSDAVDAAEWIRGALLPFGDAKIGSVIPTGFPSYVRLYGDDFPHPALDPDTGSILTRHTSTPDRCWFCLWEGYGYLTGAVVLQAFRTGDPPPPPVRTAKPTLRKSRVRLPHRNYLLFTGTTDQASGWRDGPNLCWPDDRAWIVAREIDLDYTLVGGSAGLCNELAGRGAEPVSVGAKN